MLLVCMILHALFLYISFPLHVEAGFAATCDCGTNWTFHLTFHFFVKMTANFR